MIAMPVLRMFAVLFVETMRQLDNVEKRARVGRFVQAFAMVLDIIEARAHGGVASAGVAPAGDNA